MATLPAADERVLSVGELARAIKDALSEAFPSVWVKGEISGFKHYDSGHMYFSLKDATPALVQAVMWRGSVAKLGFTPKDGTISLVAGTGKKGKSLGEGDPLKAEFNQPHGVIVHPKTRDIYISDATNGRVLKIVRD